MSSSRLKRLSAVEKSVSHDAIYPPNFGQWVIFKKKIYFIGVYGMYIPLNVRAIPDIFRSNVQEGLRGAKVRRHAQSQVMPREVYLKKYATYKGGGVYIYKEPRRSTSAS
jgi:hypothetical protein